VLSHIFLTYLSWELTSLGDGIPTPDKRGVVAHTCSPNYLGG
jgi:hypothetical protein